MWPHQSQTTQVTQGSECLATGVAHSLHRNASNHKRLEWIRNPVPLFRIFMTCHRCHHLSDLMSKGDCLTTSPSLPLLKPHSLLQHTSLGACTVTKVYMMVDGHEYMMTELWQAMILASWCSRRHLSPSLSQDRHFCVLTVMLVPAVICIHETGLKKYICKTEDQKNIYRQWFEKQQL